MKKTLIIVNTIGLALGILFFVFFNGISPKIIESMVPAVSNSTPQQNAAIIVALSGLLITFLIIAFFILLSIIICIIIKLVAYTTEKRLQKKNEKIEDGKTIEENIEKETGN